MVIALIALGLPLLGIMTSLSYLFRMQVIDNPALGIITVRYRWGRPYEITADSNRDGEADYRGFVDAPFGSIATHTAIPTEYWEDSDYDGCFESHVVLESGSIIFVEVDVDKDGRYEETLTGREATNFYESKLKGRVEHFVPDQ